MRHAVGYCLLLRAPFARSKVRKMNIASKRIGSAINGNLSHQRVACPSSYGFEWVRTCGLGPSEAHKNLGISRKGTPSRLPRPISVLPGIDHDKAGINEILNVTCDHRQTVDECSCCDQGICLVAAIWNM